MSGNFPFAILVLEREPLTLADVPDLLISWTQAVGGFAAVGLIIWLVATSIQLLELTKKGERLHGYPLLAAVFGLIYFFGFALYGIALVTHAESVTSSPIIEYLKTIGGASAIVIVLLPFARDLVRWRWRRILAIARLSAIEVWRRKVYLIFLALLTVMLFGDWFLPHKPENQLRNYVEVVYLSMALLLVLTMAVLASFSIPADIRHQTIHTVVTKPVERFEIVLGRFLGYTFVMSVTLGGLTLVSLLWVVTHGVHPDAEFESYRARVPLYGTLDFRGRQPKFEGERVGREWDYRRYIAGGPNSPQRAVWDFRTLPSRLDERGDVPCEFAFDIFRTRRPERFGQGVSCTFTFVTRAWHPARLAEYQRSRKELEERSPRPTEAEIAEQLAARYGIFEYRSKEIHDYHTLGFSVPVGLFRNARAAVPQDDGDPLVRVEVKCETPSQFIGVAKRDLYLLNAEGYFGINYFKGMVGLWCLLCLTTGLAVACSTYLSGVISLMCVLFFILLGLVRTFAVDVATGKSEGGGPLESMYRITTGMNPVTELERTPTTQVATALDEAYRWFMRGFINVIPDIEAYDLTDYVAEGFDIQPVDLGLRGLMLFGYLLPWAVLAFYLIKSREVAS
jgi:ABC-type transport system involved in multi-copper enzyme maturation permease subunit